MMSTRSGELIDVDAVSGTVRGSDMAVLAGSSIRVVANRTGIAADTLRVWERRYGFPSPMRRPGGSRVYTEDEVARLHLIARAIALGFRPSEVVALTPSDVAMLVDASMADNPDALFEASAPTIEAFLSVLMADDVVAVRAVLRAAASSLGPIAFVTEFAHPLAVRVGDLWARGLLEVRHEHVASAYLTSQLHLLMGAMDEDRGSPKVLLATLPGEAHQLGIDMVSVYLAAKHAAPRVLGADTPPSQIADAARALSTPVVGLSVSSAADPDKVTREALWLVEALPQGTELWLGGAGARRVAPIVAAAVIVSSWAELDDALTAMRASIHHRVDSARLK